MIRLCEKVFEHALPRQSSATDTVDVYYTFGSFCLDEVLEMSCSTSYQRYV